jgi:hypothetical protein
LRAGDRHAGVYRPGSGAVEPDQIAR